MHPDKRVIIAERDPEVSAIYALGLQQELGFTDVVEVADADTAKQALAVTLDEGKVFGALLIDWFTFSYSKDRPDGTGARGKAARETIEKALATYPNAAIIYIGGISLTDTDLTSYVPEGQLYNGQKPTGINELEDIFGQIP